MMDCGRCGKDCNNKTEFGYCKTTACTNPKYSGGMNVGINETIIYVPNFLNDSEYYGQKVRAEGTINSEGVRII